MTSMRKPPAAPRGFLRQKRRIVVHHPAPAVLRTGTAVMTSSPESAIAGLVATVSRCEAPVRSKTHDRPSKTVQMRAPVRSEHHEARGRSRPERTQLYVRIGVAVRSRSTVEARGEPA